MIPHHSMRTSVNTYPGQCISYLLRPLPPRLLMKLTDILKIDHLEGFKALTKLQLDNNVVEKIQGLDCLENLTWLGWGAFIIASAVLGGGGGGVFQFHSKAVMNGTI